MKSQVALIKCGKVSALYRGTHICEELIQICEVGLQLRNETCGKRLQGDSYFETVRYVFEGNSGHTSAATLAAFDKTFKLKYVERCPDTGLSNAELRCPFTFDQGLARSQRSGRISCRNRVAILSLIRELLENGP